MVYKISPVEITRRKKAYLTLSASLMAGLILASTILSFPISFGGYLLTLAAIFLIGASSLSFFRDLSKIELHLSGQSLTRVIGGVSEQYPLAKIKHVKIKWTTRHTVREINLWLDGQKGLSATALNHFEEFRNDLLDKLDKNILVKEIHEPLDFDHPLFYSILGLPISFIGLLVFKSISVLDYRHLKIGFIALSAYLFSLGVYFFATQPLSKASGNRTVTSDFIAGALMICSAMAVLFLFPGK